MSMFQPATREQNRLRMAIDGPSGCGKTYTALRLAFALAGKDGKVAVIDTEHSSASKYIGEAPDGILWQWDGCNLEHFAPSTYTAAIEEASRGGYDVLVIDSLSHGWIGAGGALDQVDKSSNTNRFAAWKDVTPQQRELIDSILRCPCHVIATLRSKMEYILEPDEKGKMKPRKVGLKPIQREGVEYEFDIIADMDLSHTMTVSKSRCPAVDGDIINCPTGSWIEKVRQWLESGSPPAPKSQAVSFEPARDDNGDLGIRRIKELCQELGWGPSALRAILAKRGASRLADLGPQQLLELTSKLERKVTDQQAKEVF